MRKRIGEVLVEQGVISAEQLNDLLAQQANTAGPRRRLGRLVVETGLADERQVAMALAGALRLPLTDLSSTRIDPQVARRLPRTISEKAGILVLSADPGEIPRIAVTDPTDVVSLDEVRLHLRTRDVYVSVAVERDLRQALARVWSLSSDHGAVSEMLDDFTDVGQVDDATAESSADDAPIVRLVDMLIVDAVGQRASDIHVETQRDGVRVRFRVDGVLRDVTSAPRSASASVTSRLKILAGLDIAERRRPQDGRAKIVAGGRQVDCRVSTLPSLYGEKIVLRLLPQGTDMPGTATLGMEPDQLAMLMRAVKEPQGLVLITGPTGAGKTSTLYAALNEVSTPDKNVVTLEDPVEVTLPGITQVNIQTKAGMTFAAGLRAVLRQDPDVVLVGEIRDLETAEHALAAAMTGHLVLSTLHTTSAVAAVSRLVDMGTPAFLLAPSLSLVVAQRLVRKPCLGCAEPAIPGEDIRLALGVSLEEVSAGAPVMGRGCDQCGHSGYRGRSGIYEVLSITPELRDALRAGGDERHVAAAAHASGVRSLRTSGMLKAFRGETTYEEVLRVTAGDGAPVDSRCTGCGGGVGPDMICCPWCGTSSDSGRCTSCNRAVEVNWRVCPWCRTPTGVAPAAASRAHLSLSELPAPQTPASRVPASDVPAAEA
ncbi:MAG TPA: ATPase, T2SS/T4P/T4SS family [Frankiaceae bacterium]|nr:ATPase, T2SS/T4P/T4SS family [Frankiaceae bacterium]